MIGDREENRACLFDGYHQDDAGERCKVLRRVNGYYQDFLRPIGAPEIELQYGHAPHRPDCYWCRLIALEMVRYVFREMDGDLVAAGARALMFNAFPSGASRPDSETAI